jgi:type II secretory pathway pseudopilin PulG
MLIEVMIGALILAITTTAVLSGLDGAQKTGGRNKARSVAAALAEQDQERMRSMPVAQLLPLVTTPYSRSVPVNGVNYTVVSSAAYANDAGAVTTGCSATAKTQTNLKITSTVSSPLTRGTVDLVGLVTPPASSGFGAGQGRIIVKVVDRDQEPIQGVNVALAGATSFSEETNAAGCANFTFVPAGNYTATISELGLVGWNGETSLSKAVTSTAGQTTTYGAYEMDRPATIAARFQTKVGSAPAIDAKSRKITINNVKLAAQWPVFDAGSNGTEVQATGLYPFLDGYGVYAGGCTANKPATVPSVTTDPATTTTTDTATNPRIWVPSINVRVVSNTSTSTPTFSNGVTVFVKSADSGCTNTFASQTTNSFTYGGSTTYSGALPEPGFPYGNYTICAQRTVSGIARRAFADVYPFTTTPTVNETVSNSAQGGTGTTWNTAGSIRIYLSATTTPAAGQSGSCPP